MGSFEEAHMTSQVSEKGKWITYRALCVRVETWDFILSEKKPWGVLSQGATQCFILTGEAGIDPARLYI